MYQIKNTEAGTLEFGGRKSNWGKVTKVRKVGTGRYAVVVVTRLGDNKERVYGNRAARRFLEILDN